MYFLSFTKDNKFAIFFEKVEILDCINLFISCSFALESSTIKFN